MQVFFSGETEASSGVGMVIGEFNEQRREYFGSRNYGEDMKEVAVFFICRTPKLKQRIRFSKKAKILYTDIMLELAEYEKYEPAMRMKAAAAQLLAELPRIIGKYKFKDFDLDRFMTDLRTFLSQKTGAATKVMH